MKTLIIISHPEIKDSITQEFLKTSQADLMNVTWHCLDEIYPNGKIDVEAEKQLVKQHDRIIFQFPLYWYSAPASLKQWEDDVLTRSFTYVNEEGMLNGKQLGIVTSVGYSEEQFAAGAAEGFSISQIMVPYEALSKRSGMQFMKPLVISQFGYLSDKAKAELLVDYQMYLTAPYPLNFHKKEDWIIEKLQSLPIKDANLIADEMKNNQDELADLKNQVNLMRREEEE